MNEKLRKGLNILLAAVLLVSLCLLLRHMVQTRENERANEQAQQIAGLAEKETVPVQTEVPETEPETVPVPEETVPPETAPPETEPPKIWVPAPVEEADSYMEKLADTNLAALREENPDVVAWLLVPNTLINYPVVQGDDNQYYLEHSWQGKKNVSGSIFLEATNSADLKDFRSILYGHSMADSTMFGSLHRYSQQQYWEDYPYIYLVTEEGVLRYEIYSGYKAEIDSNTYALHLDREADQKAFIQITLDRSEIDTGIQPAHTDRILTLSTCVGNAYYRRVVHARLAMIEVAAEQ